MKYIISFFCCLMMLLMGSSRGVAQNQNGKITVGVLDFEGRGISQIEASNLTDHLFIELLNTKVFNLVERSRIKDVGTEFKAGFAAKSPCNTIECYAEIGKILRADQMIAGSIGKIGELFTIYVQVIDVTTDSIVQIARRDYKGSFEGLLDELKNIAHELAGVKFVKNKKRGNRTKIWLWSTIGALGIGGGIVMTILSSNSDKGAPEDNGLPGPPSLPDEQ